LTGGKSSAGRADTDLKEAINILDSKDRPTAVE